MATKPATVPTNAAEGDQPKPKSLMLILLVLLVLLLLTLVGGGIGGWLYWQRSHAVAAKAAPPPPLSLLYLPIDPPFVANFQCGQGARFLQIDVRVASRSAETTELMKANEPLLRNDLLMLYGQQDATALGTREGKDRLRAESLATVRRIVKSPGGKPKSVHSVLFASFVMQ